MFVTFTLVGVSNFIGVGYNTISNDEEVTSSNRKIFSSSISISSWALAGFESIHSDRNKRTILKYGDLIVEKDTSWIFMILYSILIPCLASAFLRWEKKTIVYSMLSELDASTVGKSRNEISWVTTVRVGNLRNNCGLNSENKIEQYIFHWKEILNLTFPVWFTFFCSWSMSMYLVNSKEQSKSVVVQLAV